MNYAFTLDENDKPVSVTMTAQTDADRAMLADLAQAVQENIEGPLLIEGAK